MVTIRDIAQATGVSATTVSNVIHGRNKRVSAETIQSINDAIKELGYVPNMSARSLVSSSSSNKRVSAETIQSINDVIKELVAFLHNWNMDGLFFTGIFKDKFFDSVVGLHIPVVLIDSYVRTPQFCNVGLEDFTGSYNATHYLIQKGHRHIAFASPNIKDGGVLQERFL